MGAVAYRFAVGRRLLILAVFLGAGAVVNVAVAWGCAVAVNPTYGKEASGRIERPPWIWEAKYRKKFGSTFLVSAWARYDPSFADTYGPAEDLGPSPRRLVPSWGSLGKPTPDFAAMPDDPTGNLIVEERFLLGCGWPTRSLWCEIERDMMGADGTTTRTFDGFIDVSLEPWEITPRVLPLGVDWPRTTFNTLFYAALLWLLTPGPFVLRRFIRRHRGRCPQCAYPVGESTVCTECGQELAT